MKPKKKSSVQEFADTIQNNPKRIIAWAKREVSEYKKLIAILEKPKKVILPKNWGEIKNV